LKTSALLITPPFTQLNTPYPATMYLKGFLNTQNRSSFQVDMGLEVILKLLNKTFLAQLFEQVEASDLAISDESFRTLQLKNHYLACINPVIKFLQHKNPTLAYNIAQGDFLPKGVRFKETADLEWAFGAMGIQDKARYFATLFLQDLGDFIRETTDEHFEFSRYAERLGRSATHFDELEESLNAPPSLIDGLMEVKLIDLLKTQDPTLVIISVPFPGNLYAGLRIAKLIKQLAPQTKIAMGGGYPNTELRNLKEPRLFKYIDFLCLDDGERPLLNILEYLEGKRPIEQLKRTFALKNKQVAYYNSSLDHDFPFTKVGTI
jgi:hypothetical protein